MTPVEVTGDAKPLDVAAAWNADRSAITIGVVNPTLNTVELKLQFANVEPAENGTVWVITGADRMAYNEPGKEPSVTIQEQAYRGMKDNLSVAPLSVSLYELKVK